MMKNTYTLLPTEEQKVMLEKTFKCCRDVRNELIRRAINIYEDTLSLKGMRGDFAEEKWKYLKEVDSGAIAHTISSTISNFTLYIDFKNEKDKPEYLTSVDDQLYHTYNHNDDIVIIEDTISLPKIGVVKIDIGNNTIPEDKRVYFVSVRVHRKYPENPEYSVFVIYKKYIEEANIKDKDV